MNTCASIVLLKPQKGETTLYITNMTKANVSIPRTIKWDEVTLPEKWVMDKATPSIPRSTPTIEQIKQDNSGKVEITFNRRNTFSSRIEASRQSEYESARRPFSIKSRSIPVGLSRSESQPISSINLQGLDTTSRIPRTTYNQEPEDDQKYDFNKWRCYSTILRRLYGTFSECHVNLLDVEGPNASSSRVALTDYAATVVDNRDYILSQDFFCTLYYITRDNHNVFNGFDCDRTSKFRPHYPSSLSKFCSLLSLSLHSSSSTFKLLSMASYGGGIVLDSSSPSSGISNHLSSFSIPLPYIFKK
ncbi:hypothetical protein D0Y65_015633 [Glycine soja]|uniref:Uncharacterized protein n=1 Tax=Glycine soja TaxID=3848 RepID=A0A445KDT0_GLYSO|nr:hypothetical protein D0Y65_015633 [Glycine soja]